MDEAFRILGREHEADLEREALKWQRADEVRRALRTPGLATGFLRERKKVPLVPARVAGFVARLARVGE
jgi:hypothetical protein